MIKFDITSENIKQHNSIWMQIPDNWLRMLIIGVTEFG